jgi:hypothetical protein
MFENFSKINYYLNGQTLELTDIFKSIKIDTNKSTDVSTIKNTDKLRPDQLAQKLYNDPKLFWVNLLLNDIKNPFREWSQSGSALIQQNSDDYDMKAFQFGNTSKYLPSNGDYFNSDDIDSYSGITFNGIQQNDLIVFETGAGSFELKTYGAGQVSAADSCGYPHFGQSDIPDNFLNRNNIIQISCGKDFTACLDDSGYIWAWGQDIGLSDYSGFIQNGRLYNSPRGGYKHIDTITNKIIAVNSQNSLECFGICYDFPYVGETDVVKSAWTTGQTLAGVIIKSDDTLEILGPIVSTNNTLQYFSDISCADDYCLGVATGPSSGGKVIGFGSTGYFSQIGQNTFYSKELQNLEPVVPSNPVYPFTDSNNQIIKNYANGVLEVSIKDLQPFTSPTGNPHTPYRSQYQKVFGSDGSEKTLIGFTDHDTLSKEGFVLNNPKAYAGGSSPFLEGLTYNYTEYYDENLKPKNTTEYVFNMFPQEKYSGISFINDVSFYNAIVGTTWQVLEYEPGMTEWYQAGWVRLPYFTVKYSPEYYNSGNIKNYFGAKYSLINDDGTLYYPFIGNNPYSRTSHTTIKEFPQGLTGVEQIGDGGFDVYMYNTGKIQIIRPEAFIQPPEYLKNHWYWGPYANPEKNYCALKSKDYPNGITFNWRNVSFFEGLPPFKTCSKNNSRIMWFLDYDGNPYLFAAPGNPWQQTYYADQGYYDWGPKQRDFWDTIGPPSGMTFEKIENACWGSFFAAGLKNNGEIVIWGPTLCSEDQPSDLTVCFGITQSPYTVPGITAKDITVNQDNIIAVKNNGTISLLGGTTFFNGLEGFYEGFTVSNAIKVVGPDAIGLASHIFIQTSDNKFKHFYPTDPSVPGTNWWKSFGVTLGAMKEPTTEKKFLESILHYFNNNNWDAEKILFNDANDIKNIEGYAALCMITKNDNTKYFAMDQPLNNAMVRPPWAFVIDITTSGYGTNWKNIKLSSFSWIGDYSFLNTKTNLVINIPGVYGTSIKLFTGYVDGGLENTRPIYETTYGTLLGDYNRDYLTLSHYQYFLNTSDEEGIQRVSSLGAGWLNNYWHTNLDYVDVRDLVYGGATCTTSYSSNNGVLFSLDYSDLNNSFIVNKSEYTYKSLKLPSKYKPKHILGNGFVVTLLTNDKLIFTDGDSPPFNYVKDFTKLSTINTINAEFSDDFDFWQDSIVEKMAMGVNSVYTYQPSWGNNRVNYWGIDYENITPRGLTYIEIDCFAHHCCGIKPDGKVECWGTDTSGIWVQQPDGTVLSGSLAIPNNLGICNKVAVGYDHSCAETVSGNIICWGANDYGQSTVPTHVNDGTSNSILDCGKYFSTVLKQDGRILVWGKAITGPAEIITLGNSIPTELELGS